MKNRIDTHHRIDRTLCGTPEAVKDGTSRVVMTTDPLMTVDEKGLVHGGFIFGLADHAAMIAVNHPHVVLGAASVKFLKPVEVGDSLRAEAVTTEVSGKKHTVGVTVSRGEDTVFTGEFDCFVLDQHVLDK